jgi:hypothetical protein
LDQLDYIDGENDVESDDEMDVATDNETAHLQDEITMEIPSLFQKLHWKTTFQETSQEMKGKALYNIYVPPLPPPVVDPIEEEKMKKSKKRKSEGIDEKKEREQQETATAALEAAKKWENDYLQKLFDQTTAVDTNMSSRIHPPAGLLENYPIAQLLVMDVYLQLPKPNKLQPPESANARRGSVTSSSTPAALFPVESIRSLASFLQRMPSVQRIWTVDCSIMSISMDCMRNNNDEYSIHRVTMTMTIGQWDRTPPWLLL